MKGYFFNVEYENYIILACLLFISLIIIHKVYKLLKNRNTLNTLNTSNTSNTSKNTEKYLFHFIIRTINYHNHHEIVKSDTTKVSLEYKDKLYNTNIDKCFKQDLGLIDKLIKGTDKIYFAIFDDERNGQIISHPNYNISAELNLRVREYKGLKGIDKEFEKIGSASNIPWWVYIVILVVAVIIMVLYLNSIGFFTKFLEALANADKVKPK